MSEGLPLPRKQALMGKLDAFAVEVDRDRTRVAAFGALIIEVASGAAKVERKLRPIRKWLDSSAAKDAHDRPGSRYSPSFAGTAGRQMKRQRGTMSVLLDVSEYMPYNI